tara:strand:- start:4086 stop:4418 length:333 start_codon:yes stop_codon:yes gene_type:complete
MNSSDNFMFSAICQICKNLTDRGNICKICFLKHRRLKQIEYWNDWIKETKKCKSPKKIRFIYEEDIEIVRSIEQEVNLKIASEVMDTLQDMIYAIVETKKNKKQKLKKRN